MMPYTDEDWPWNFLPYRMTADRAEIIGDKAMKDYLEAITKGAFPITAASKELKKPLVFSQVNMEWSEDYKTFYSVDTLRLLNVMEQVINGEVKAFIELRKNTGGDSFSIYLEVNPDLWYYFDYDLNEFSVLSSDESFNDANKGVEIAGIDKKEAYINKFRAIYLGQDIFEEEFKTEEEDKEKKEDEDDDGF